MLRLRLTHPKLDLSIDVRLRELDGRWLVVADLVGGPDVGKGVGPQEALLDTLAALGPRLVQELVAGAILAAGTAGWPRRRPAMTIVLPDAT